MSFKPHAKDRPGDSTRPDDERHGIGLATCGQVFGREKHRRLHCPTGLRRPSPTRITFYSGVMALDHGAFGGVQDGDTPAVSVGCWR